MQPEAEAGKKQTDGTRLAKRSQTARTGLTWSIRPNARTARRPSAIAPLPQPGNTYLH